MRVVSSSNPLLLLGEFQRPHTTHSAAKVAKEGASKGRGESTRASKCARTSMGARPRRGEHVSKEEEGSEKSKGMAATAAAAAMRRPKQ
eukprot:1155081-Pelagomonas_calceolata.AAC.8